MHNTSLGGGLRTDVSMNETHLGSERNELLDALSNSALQPNDHELLRRLADVLGITQGSRVLLIAAPHSEAQRVLEAAFGCRVTVAGEQTLPFDDACFDSAIVTRPLTRPAPVVARELARVLKPRGTLGMLVYSMHRDHLVDSSPVAGSVPLLAAIRPAAACRAVLAECGFTAFVSMDRRRDVRRSALEIYREHLLGMPGPGSSDDTMAQALGLIANGAVEVTIITAENSA
jgi:SAM-dependent methyltransferase